MRTVRSPLSQAEALRRLALFGTDWHESKLPGDVRRRGIFGCTVLVSGHTFTLKLEPQGNGPHLEWYGDVRECDHAAGSELRLDWRLTPFSRVASMLLLALPGWALWTDGFGAAMSWGTFVGIGMGGAVAWRVWPQRVLCEDILEHVVGTPSDSSRLSAPAS